MVFRSASCAFAPRVDSLTKRFYVTECVSQLVVVVPSIIVVVDISIGRRRSQRCAVLLDIGVSGNAIGRIIDDAGAFSPIRARVERIVPRRSLTSSSSSSSIRIVV